VIAVDLIRQECILVPMVAKDAWLHRHVSVGRDLVNSVVGCFGRQWRKLLVASEPGKK
jgi:hypothetical protein